MDEFIKKLENDQIIRVHTATEPVDVPKSVLSNLDDWLAQEVNQACETAATTDEQPEIMSFWDHGSLAVLSFFFWAYKHELAPEYTDADSEADHMAHWILADHCEHPALQDAVMLELLRNDPNIKYDTGNIIHVLGQAQRMQDRSQLKRLFAEAFVRRMEGGDLSIVKMAELIHDLGGQAELWKAYHRYTKYGKEISIGLERARCRRNGGGSS